MRVAHQAMTWLTANCAPGHGHKGRLAPGQKVLGTDGILP
jgi:hypothetical protein